MADVQIFEPKNVPVPSNYVVKDAEEIELKAVNADFDGAGAGSTWLPCVTLLSDAGEVIARAVDQDVTVAAGGSAEVSWFPRVRRRRGTTTTGQRCKSLGKGYGNQTLTITLTAPVPADGVLQVVYNSTTIGDSTYTQFPDNASDSNAVAGWEWPAAGIGHQAFIGEISETIAGSGPPAVSVVGSVCRACTTADLGIGDTITVHFDTIFPAELVTCGIVIWQRGFDEAIKQSGAFTYFNGDDHPGSGAALNRLSWVDDFVFPGTAPDRDALTLMAMGAYPAVAGFAPFHGTVIDEVASGAISVAAVCFATEVGDDFDPGGTWPSNAIQLVGNYQTVYPRTFSSELP